MASNTVTVATLTAMLTNHKVSLQAAFNTAFSKLETKLNNIQATLLDHQWHLSSLEDSATTTSRVMQAMESKITAVTEENTMLKAKLTDLESRSRRNNIRIVGLPEVIEGPQPTSFFFQFLLEVFVKGFLTSAPELERAHRMLAAKPGPGEKPRAVLLPPIPDARAGGA